MATMKHVVSPKNISGAIFSPCGLFRQPREKGTPNSVLFFNQGLGGTPCLKKIVPSTASSSSAVLLSRRNHVKSVTPSVPKKSKSARKLSWSDGAGNSDSESSFAQSVLARFGISDRQRKSNHCQLSVDTPHRLEVLKTLKERKNVAHFLGKGSYGTVVEACYKGSLVAVKIVGTGSEGCRQILNEMNALRLHHTNIVAVLKVVLPIDSAPGIVIMEKVPGFSLQKILDFNFVQGNIERRLRYSLHISSALAYCHKKGILHLDLKPQNVLVDIFLDMCKLCDFGSSSVMEAKNFQLQGTKGYVAPELLKGGPPSTAADVYSLGITLWQLVSGEMPFIGEPEHSVIYKVVATAYRPKLPKVCLPEDESFLGIAKKCWAQVPSDRPPILKVLEELNFLSQNCI